MSSKNLEVFASTDRGGLHCTMVRDRTKTRMNDEYSLAMFLVTFLRVKIKLWVRLDLDTIKKLFCKP